MICYTILYIYIRLSIKFLRNKFFHHCPLIIIFMRRTGKSQNYYPSKVSSHAVSTFVVMTIQAGLVSTPQLDNMIHLTVKPKIFEG